MATKSKSKRAKKTASTVVRAAVRVPIQEKRGVNFFVRIKKSNAVWMKEQAKANNCNTSVFADGLIERLKAGENVKTL